MKKRNKVLVKVTFQRGETDGKQRDGRIVTTITPLKSGFFDNCTIGFSVRFDG